MTSQLDSKTAVTLMHHLGALQTGKLDEVMLDYTEGSVLMGPERSFQGLVEIRAFFEAAVAGFPPEMLAAFALVHQDIHGEVAYIVWKAEGFVKLGTDTFIIRDGKIVAQTFLMTM